MQKRYPVHACIWAPPKSPCPPPPPPVQQNTFVICVWAGRPPLFSRRAAPVVSRRFQCAPGYVSSDVQVDRRRRANTCSRCRGSERHPSLSPSVRRGPCSPVPEARTCHQTRCRGRRVMVGRIPTVYIYIQKCFIVFGVLPCIYIKTVQGFYVQLSVIV